MLKIFFEFVIFVIEIVSYVSVENDDNGYINEEKECDVWYLLICCDF